MNRIESLLLRALAKQPLDYWNLLVVSGAHYSLFLKALKTLLSQNWIIHQNQLYTLSPKGAQLVQQKGLCKPLLTPEALQHLTQIAQGRPQRKDALDQALAPIEVIVDRLAFFHEKGDLHQTRFALLGDDDCMGAALALTEMTQEVVILEFDAAMCSYYRKLGLPNLKVYEHDLCRPVPESVRGTCDLFFTDPCPSATMQKVFLSRGLETLKGEHCVGYSALSQTEASAKKWHLFQNLLIRAGCALTDIRPHFNTYDLEGGWLLESGWNVVTEAPFPPPQPSVHWYCSALMRFETIRTPSLLIEETLDWDLAHYKDEEVILTQQEKALYCETAPTS